MLHLLLKMGFAKLKNLQSTSCKIIFAAIFEINVFTNAYTWYLSIILNSFTFSFNLGPKTIFQSIYTFFFIFHEFHFIYLVFIPCATLQHDCATLQHDCATLQHDCATLQRDLKKN